MKRKCRTVFLAFLAATLFAASPSTFAQRSSSAEATLQQYVAELQNSPDNQDLREQIIRLVATMHPQPKIPDEAIQHGVRGSTFAKEAESQADYQLALKEYRQALLLAPWWGKGYYNEGLVLQAAKQFDAAIADFNLYLLTNPADAAAVNERITAIDAEIDLANKHREEELALINAASSGDLDKVQTLLAQGVDVTGDIGVGALLGSAQNGHLEIVQALLKHGLDADATPPYSGGRTALMEAAQNGRLDIVQVLLEHGANANAKGAYGLGSDRPVLVDAVEYVKQDSVSLGIVKALVAHGADVNATDSSGSTALMYAAHAHNNLDDGHGYLDIVQFLVEHGADVNAKDNYGGTAIDGTDQDVQNYLHSHGALYRGER